MATVEYESYRVHYEPAGPSDGEPVILHHGLFQPGREWSDHGFVELLQDHYRVLALDSFGHGMSDDPRDDAVLGREARAGAVVALADAEGLATFHFAGHSMGGWIGAALALRHPERLRSLSFGGWDVVGGFDTAKRWTKDLFGVDLDFDLIFALASSREPAIADAPPRRVDGWRRTLDLIDMPTNDLETIRRIGIPVHFWCGREDPYRDAMQEAALTLGAPFDAVPGDHVLSFYSVESSHALRRFLDAQAF